MITKFLGSLLRRLALFTPLLLASCLGTGDGYNLGPTQNPTGAVGGLTIEGGVPTGNWMCRDYRAFGSFAATINSGLNVDDDGTGTLTTAHIIDWPPGQVCGYGVFAGQKRVAWTTVQPLKTIKREGNKIYAYVDPGSRAKLYKASPSGHSLATYQSLGGALLGGFRSPLDEVGVSVFELSGKNLILVSAPDKARRTFVRAEFGR